MNIIVKAALFHSLENIETFYIQIPADEDNYILIRKRLEYERELMIDCLKDLQSKKLINIIANPIDKTLLKEVRRGDRMTNLRQKRKTPLQVKIDNLVKIKKELKKSIQSIKDFYA